MVQGSKAYIDELLDMSEPPDTSNCKSEVNQYYTGRNILVTGASGFFGILLIEKLLRCCPGIGKIYMFLRSKKGKSTEERLKEHFDCIIYDRLRHEQPDFITKIIMIESDFNEANLGISPENRKRLLDTNIIFHMAATVRFNETMKVAVNINVKGTKEMLLLAQKMPDMQAFVYVSTAFSHCVQSVIDEKLYTPPMETDKILTLLDTLDDKYLEKITPTLLGDWPNTYVFSKAIAEDTVRQYSVGLPTCIVRPSIVTSTGKEPISGWINNIYGPSGIVVGSGLGLLRSLHCVSENIADMVPADYAISNIIVAGWDIAKRKDTLLSIDNSNSDFPKTERIPVYNYVSSAQNPITWKRYMKINEECGLQMPCLNSIWYYMFYLNKHRFIHEICVLFLHIIPGAIFDFLAFLSGRKPMLLKAYKKVGVFGDAISYFSTRQWQFRNDSVMNLWDRLNPVDREIFDFNIQDLSWENYLKNKVSGLRLYILKESMDNLDEAVVRYKKLKIAHYTILTVTAIILIYAIVRLVNLLLLFF